MQTIQKLALTGTFLAATGLMTATPASGMFIMHDTAGVLFSDDLQGYTVGSAPGGGWSATVTHGTNGATTALNFARMFDDAAGTVYNYTGIGGGSESIGVLPGAPLPGHTKYIGIFTGARSQIGNRTGSNWAVNANHAAQTTGVLNYEFFINGDINNNGRNSGGDIRVGSEVLAGQLYNGATLGAARITWLFGGTLPNRTAELRINGTNYSTGKTTSDGQGTGLFINQDQWHKINISIDLDMGIFGVAVDDVWSISTYSLQNSNPISAITFTKGIDQSHLFIGSPSPSRPVWR
jgi:hypothetical protein